MRLFKFVKDLIFPAQCLGCSRIESVLCRSCLTLLPPIPKQRCAGCESVNYSGKTCSQCLFNDFPLDGLLISALYEEHKTIAKMICALKYRNCREFVPFLGQRLATCITKFVLKNYLHPLMSPCNKIVFIPIPLSRKKLRRRGFNQTEFLAEYIFTELEHYPSYSALFMLEKNVLFRKNQSHAQVSSNRVERFESSHGAFYLNEGLIFNKSPCSIFLIDDVYTTGATMTEAASILKEHFPETSVWGLVIARKVSESLISQ